MNEILVMINGVVSFGIFWLFVNFSFYIFSRIFYWKSLEKNKN